MDGKKIFFGVYIFFDKENRADQNKVFEDLINRGFKKVLIVVSNDFPIIIETIKAVYPNVDHQLCLFHLQRNASKHIVQIDISKFDKELDTSKLALFFNKAVEKLKQLNSEFKEIYIIYVNIYI